MYIEDCLLVKHEKINENEYLLTLKTEKIVKESKAGQFVQVKVGETSDPILRRPISIHTVDKKNNLLVLYYQVVGKGTKLLENARKDEVINIIGPLGNGFDTEIKESKALLIGGGLGQAPLLYLAEELEKNNNELYIALGTRSGENLKNIVCLEGCCKRIEVATEDGSLGKKGYVTDQLPAIIEDFKPERIYACGPMIMMSKIKDIAQKYKIPCQVSLETKMACGIGVCLGCTVKSVDEEKPYLKACQDGPVFWAEEVILDE